MPSDETGRKVSWSSNTVRNIELGIGVLTLIIIAFQGFVTLIQAKQTGLNVEIIKKNVEIGEYKLINKHLQTINLALIDPDQDEDFYKPFAKSRQEILAFMLLADYETFYEMSVHNVMSESSWCRVYEYMNLVARNDGNFKDVWKNNGRIGKIEGFVSFMDCLVEQTNDAGASHACGIKDLEGHSISCNAN